MRTAWRVTALGLAAALWIAPAGPARSTLPSDIPTVAPVLREVTPGVVNIAVRQRVRVAENPLMQDPFFRQFFGLRGAQPRERETEAAGSGVIVDAQRGYVLTNNHVVEDADVIEVTTKDKRRFRGRLVGRDPHTDIAVVKIDASNLVAVPLGDSDQLEVGDFVLAIGNPFALGQTVTSGIVSALHQTGLKIEDNEDFIQTDAPINPGNSGGALIDLRGRLIGINTAILAPSGGNVGIGFAVPINMARTVMEQIIAHGQVRHGRIGIGIEDVTPDLAAAAGTQRSDGAIVTQVRPGSPAERAGIRTGDVVVALNGQPIHSASQLGSRIDLAQVGERVQLTLERNGRQRTVAAVVAPVPPNEEQQQAE